MDVQTDTSETKADLAKQVAQLRLEHERLKVENEITHLERHITHLEQSMIRTSTPYHRRYGVLTPPISKKKVAWKGDDTPIDGAFTEPRRLFQQGSGLLDAVPYPRDPEEFVTKRCVEELERKEFVRPAAYGGLGSWTDYKAHFDTCAEINNWSYKEKGLHLAVSLRGQAQGIFGNLDHNSKVYDSFTKAVRERFAPPNQTEFYRVQLRERRQKAAESLSELGQDIRRLTNSAYPTAPSDVRETLAKEQFIDSLVSVDMRLRVKQS